MRGNGWLSAITESLFGRPTPVAGTVEPRSHRPQFNQEVAGESFYQEALKALAGGHARRQHRLVCTAHLVRDPTNAYDANAIRVEIDGRLVGYLPTNSAARFALSAKKLVDLPPTVPALIVGGWKTNQHDAGHFGVLLDL
jgi:hypothetical protein